MKADPTTRDRARRMRRKLTDAETILWSRLKGRQLGGWQFRRQHPVGVYIADFACTARRLIVEVDGATHSTDEEIAHDRRRTAFLAGQDWTVLRFWNDEIYRNLEGVLRVISDCLPPKEG